MNTWVIVFAAVIAAVVADPSGVEVVSVQQDTLGNYKYSIDSPHGLSRVEQRNILSPVTGYSYVNPYTVLRRDPYAVQEHGLYPIAANIPLTVEATPRLTLAQTEHLPILRNVELVQTPLIKELEIPQLPLVKSSLVEAVPVATTSLLRVGAIPESPQILELEAKQFAGHVAVQNHHFI